VLATSATRILLLDTAEPLATSTLARRRTVGETRPPAPDVSARKHYKQMIVLRAALAPWIMFVTVLPCAKGY
jgi:hypothetical protein